MKLKYEDVHSAALKTVAGQGSEDDLVLLRSASRMLMRVAESNRDVVKYVRAGGLDGDDEVIAWIKIQDRVRLGLQKGRKL